MKKKEKKKYLRVLELGDKASRDDIENAYSHFVKLYSFGDSPEINPLKEEIDSEEREEILSEIDKAYKALVGEDAVNRMEFTAEIEPQEIILDGEEDTAKEEEKKVQPVETLEEDEPFVEFVENGEPVIEIPAKIEIELPVEEETMEIDESEEQVVEKPESEVEENEIPVKIEIELPVEEETMEIDESEEPVVEIHENEISVEIEDHVAEHSVPDSESVLDEQDMLEKDVVEITGKFFKNMREARKLKVRELGSVLGISYKDIVNIENEKFEKLTDPGYLRWLIKSYAKFIGIDEDKSAEDYMKRYRSKK
ncbi:MAG: helix-turn-helix domain-containing protein [Acidobacteriota bacterium]